MKILVKLPKTIILQQKFLDKFPPFYSGRLLVPSTIPNLVERSHNYNTSPKKHILQELNSTNIKDLQEQRTQYEDTFTQDKYDCNHDDSNIDNELKGYFFQKFLMKKKGVGKIEDITFREK